MIVCWSAKGGSGATVVSALLAMAFAKLGQRTLLLDASHGDLPMAFGLQGELPNVGLTQWVGAASDVPPSSLAHVGTDLLLNLRLVISGDSHAVDFTEDAAEKLARGLPGFHAIVDAPGPSLSTSHLAKHAEMSLCIIRPCYLAASRIMKNPIRADGLIVVEEMGRTLQAQDLEDALDIPVVAKIRWDSAIARAVDSGRLGAANLRSTKAIGELVHRLVNQGSAGSRG